MAEQLKIIPLGGLNEIGKNMTVYEYGGEIIVVDCGMAFPGDDMYGIDCVIPDVTYLVKHKNRIRGLFITHGHEDHIGAIPYILKQINLPINWGGVDLKVARVYHGAEVCMNGESDGVRDGVVDVDKLHAELARLDRHAGFDRDDLRGL